MNLKLWIIGSLSSAASVGMTYTDLEVMLRAIATVGGILLTFATLTFGTVKFVQEQMDRRRRAQQASGEQQGGEKGS